MRAALLAIALTLGFAAPAGPRDAVSGRPSAATGPADAVTSRAAAARADGLLLLAVLSPERAMLADPRTGATTARELPGGTLCHGPLLAAGDRAVVFDLDRRNTLVARAIALDGRGPDRTLGRADAAIASTTPDRLWLGRTLRAGRHTRRIVLREIDAGGRVVGRAGGLLPRWAGLTAVMDDGGLVFTRGRGLAVSRPGRPRLLFEGGWPMAADGERLAWCGRRCRRVRIQSAAGERSSLHPMASARGHTPHPPSRPTDAASRCRWPARASPCSTWRPAAGASCAGPARRDTRRSRGRRRAAGCTSAAAIASTRGTPERSARARSRSALAEP